MTNKGDEAEGLSLEVLDGNEVIYSEQQTGKYFDKGEHAWQWDGYSNQGILDTTKEGANKRGNSSRLTQSFHFFMFEPIFSPVNALNQPI
ncbi:hypothetical protein D6T60_28475 [Escherichia coli]|nr:hypothetical protein D6T60_28475 [Escherichia coli]